MKKKEKQEKPANWSFLDFSSVCFTVFDRIFLPNLSLDLYFVDVSPGTLSPQNGLMWVRAALDPVNESNSWTHIILLHVGLS